jgi:hypothetical protein
MTDLARLERVGVGVVVGLTVIALLLLGVVGVIKTAAADLHMQAEIARHNVRADARSSLGERLSAGLASDVRSDDVAGLDARASQLDQRSDRLLEATAVVALVGMLVGLIAARPDAVVDPARREAKTPLANTSSNGTV